jgi:hypothetical protein
MSTWRTGRDAGVARLVEEGFEARHVNNHLVIQHVPYLTSSHQVQYGKLVAPITWVGNDYIEPPADHVVWFQGETPCDVTGAPLSDVIHSSISQEKFPGFPVNFMFSKKPAAGYPNHYAKMTAYIAMLLGPAQAVDPNATPNTFAKLPEMEEWSPFRYRDSASARAGISELNAKVRGDRIAIIGLGGTGSYILDLVAKTEVAEIHLIDGDEFINHNAFRAPGAASLDQIVRRRKKVDYFAEAYEPFRSGVVPHGTYVNSANAWELLNGMDFVFLAADHTDEVADVAQWMRETDIRFIDVGVGLSHTSSGLNGTVRTTLIVSETPQNISVPSGVADDEYAVNIQVAEVNAMNAVLAVLRWKRLAGFYADGRSEYLSTYSLAMNAMGFVDES